MTIAEIRAALDNDQNVWVSFTDSASREDHDWGLILDIQDGKLWVGWHGSEVQGPANVDGLTFHSDRSAARAAYLAGGE